MSDVETKIKKVWNKLQLEEDNQNVRTFLSFRIAQDVFAINVTRVSEILEVPSMTCVPKSPKELIGVFNLRGSVLPIIDARIKFAIKELSYTVDTCILVIEVQRDNENISLGLLVDGVEEVVEISESNINTSKNIASKYIPEIFEGVAKFKNDFINILKLDQVVNRSKLLLDT